jgi:hypothetical protein
MKFGRIVAASIAILLISSIPAISAVKAGSTCKKIGQTTISKGKTYTCIKSGKKKVWSKGVTIKTAAPAPVANPTPTPTPSPTPSSSITPTPTPTPTPTFSAWSTDFRASDMYLSALKKTFEFFSAGKESQENLTLKLQNTFESEDATLLKSIAIASHSIFYPTTKQSTVLIFATDPKWAGEQAKELNLRVNSFELPCGGNGTWDSYCASDKAGFMIYNGRYEDAKKRNLERLDFGVGAKSVVAHEYFHTVQFALTNREVRNPASPLFIPMWLYEGSANYIGFAVIEFSNIGKYTDGRYSEVEAHPDYKNKESSASLREFREYSSKVNGVSLNPYGIGMAATEYIVASAGIQSLLNIFEYTKSSTTFEEAFERATGISLENFYDKFDKARPSLLVGSR